MNETEALSLMKAPGSLRPGKWRGGVIQIHVTRACDRSCYACTQGSNLAGKPYFISLDSFEVAVKSLIGYPGVVGIFGGNPALHPEFPTLCSILSSHIPFEQRGLWCNHPRGHGVIMGATFNPRHSNLNVHQSVEAYEEFKRDWPTSMPCGLHQDSRHSPVFYSMMDAGIPEEERWELISNCDINQHWSALVGEFRGVPRAWFCEIAASQAINQQDRPCPVCKGEKRFPVVPVVHSDVPQSLPCNTCQGTGMYPDTGIFPTDGWWKEPMEAFASQVRFHCHQCGVPLRGYGQLANSPDSTPEQTSPTYLPMFKPKRKRTVTVPLLQEIRPKSLERMTDYIGNSQK